MICLLISYCNLNIHLSISFPNSRFYYDSLLNINIKWIINMNLSSALTLFTVLSSTASAVDDPSPSIWEFDKNRNLRASGNNNNNNLFRNNPPNPKKVDICHYSSDEGRWIKINISEKAISSHFENHDDAMPGGSTSGGTQLDDDCATATTTTCNGQCYKYNRKTKELSINEPSITSGCGDEEFCVSSFNLSSASSCGRIQDEVSDLCTPSHRPSISPTISNEPSLSPSYEPSDSKMPSNTPSGFPSLLPTNNPSSLPSYGPSVSSSFKPSLSTEPSIR